MALHKQSVAKSIFLALALAQVTSIAGQQCQMPFHWIGSWWLGYVKTPTGHGQVFEEIGAGGILTDKLLEPGQPPQTIGVTCLSYDEVQAPPFKFFTRRNVGAPASEVFCVQNLQIGNLMLQRSKLATANTYANQCPGYFTPPSDAGLLILLKHPFDASLGQCVGATVGANSPPRAKIPVGRYQATVHVNTMGDIRCAGDPMSHAIVTETSVELHTCVALGDYYWPTSGMLRCAGSFDTTMFGDTSQGANGYSMIFTREDNGNTYIYYARFAIDTSGTVVDISISIQNPNQAVVDVSKDFKYVEENKFIRITLTLDNCAATRCQNGGTCKNENGIYKCVCRPGYFGPLCQTSGDPCKPNPCSSSRTKCVVDGTGTVQCICEKGFNGPNCQNAPVQNLLAYYILGGVLGGLILLILLVVCCCYCCRDGGSGSSRFKTLRKRKHGILVEKDSASAITVGPPASTVTVVPTCNRGLGQQTYAVGGQSVCNAPVTAASNPTTVTLLLQSGGQKPQVVNTTPVCQNACAATQPPTYAQAQVQPVPITQALYPNLNGVQGFSQPIRGNTSSRTGTIHLAANGYK